MLTGTFAQLTSDEWRRSNFRYRSAPIKFEPVIDEPITKVVGHKVFQRDPRVIKLIMKWKRNKPLDSQEPDNFLQNPNFVKELKEALAGGF